MRQFPPPTSFLGSEPADVAARQIQSCQSRVDRPHGRGDHRVRPLRRAVAQAAAAAVDGVPGGLRHGGLSRRRPRDRRGAGHRPDRERRPGRPGLESVTSTTREGLALCRSATSSAPTSTTRSTRCRPRSTASPPSSRRGWSRGALRWHRRPAGLMLAASGGADADRAGGQLRETVVPELSAIEGVRTVEVTGDREQLVVITPDARKLAAARLPATAIGTALQVQRHGGAGRRRRRWRQEPHRAGRRALATLDDLRGIYLTGPGAGPVRLGDVAAVEQRVAPADLDQPYQRRAEPRHPGHRHPRRQRGRDLTRRAGAAGRSARPPPARS